MMRLTNALLFCILVLIAFPFLNPRPKHLLSVARRIDHLVHDSLVVTRRDGQCYISIRESGSDKQLVPVRVQRWRFGKSHLPKQSQPDLISIVKIMDRADIDYIETTYDYIFGVTLFHRAGRTYFLYPRRGMSTKIIDSVFRHCYSCYSIQPFGTLEGNEHFRYMIIPND